MKKDIPFHKVEDVGMAVVPEPDALVTAPNGSETRVPATVNASPTAAFVLDPDQVAVIVLDPADGFSR